MNIETLFPHYFASYIISVSFETISIHKRLIKLLSWTMRYSVKVNCCKRRKTRIEDKENFAYLLSRCLNYNRWISRPMFVGISHCSRICFLVCLLQIFSLPDTTDVRTRVATGRTLEETNHYQSNIGIRNYVGLESRWDVHNL